VVHSFGLTPTRALIVTQPLRVPMLDAIFGALLKGAVLLSRVTQKNLMWVVDHDAIDQYTLIRLPGIFFGFHTISATDESDSVHSSIRLVGSQSPDQVIGENGFLFRDRAQSVDERNQIAELGTPVEIRTDGVSATIQWYDIQQDSFPGFDSPIHRYSRTFNFSDD